MLIVRDWVVSKDIEQYEWTSTQEIAQVNQDDGGADYQQ
jgi:hypothetical protein